MIESSQFSRHIRPLDNTKDLNPVADLIETCFSDHMDADGREYLHQIRRAASDLKFLHWLPGAGEMASYPLHGYVWEENNTIIGNLTLIPSYVNNQWRYMIVNVAVHPDHRRRGIARQLTIKGLEHVRDHGAAAAWLQVRDDNPTAIQLYLSLGFKERARRSIWITDNHDFDKPGDNGIRIDHRQDKEWNLHHTWLKHDYPPEVSWHLPFSIRKFKPSIVSKLDNFFSDLPTTHWTVYLHGTPIGFITHEPTRQSADTLWLAVSPQHSDLAIKNLLAHIHHTVPAFRSITANYPANVADEAFRLNGFSRQNTLIWMEVAYHTHPASFFQRILDRIALL